METVISIIAILGALGLGVVSPGPSFLLVAKIAVAASRVQALAAAIGMGLGGLIFASAASLGLHMFLTKIEWLYLALRVLGGAYLIYLGYRMWKAAGCSIDEESTSQSYPMGGAFRALGFGLATQLSNPKTAIVYASVFAALLPREFPPIAWSILLPSIFVLEAGWYCIVALVFSAASSRSSYLMAKRYIDAVAAAVIVGLGLKLIVEAARSRTTNVEP